MPRPGVEQVIGRDTVVPCSTHHNEFALTLTVEMRFGHALFPTAGDRRWAATAERLPSAPLP